MHVHLIGVAGTGMSALGGAARRGRTSGERERHRVRSAGGPVPRGARHRVLRRVAELEPGREPRLGRRRERVPSRQSGGTGGDDAWASNRVHAWRACGARAVASPAIRGCRHPRKNDDLYSARVPVAAGWNRRGILHWRASIEFRTRLAARRRGRALRDRRGRVRQRILREGAEVLELPPGRGNLDLDRVRPRRHLSGRRTAT